jgi:hypothetical protein
MDGVHKLCPKLEGTATTIPTYVMSTFILPTFICKTLDKKFKNLWWGFPNGKSRNLSLKSWKTICTPRNEGGLGLCSM